MGHNRRDEDTIRRLRLQERTEAKTDTDEVERDGFVFDFTGLHRPDLSDLSLILTARLQAGSDHRVWVRALPVQSWRVLHKLGLHHLFQPYPGGSGELN